MKLSRNRFFVFGAFITALPVLLWAGSLADKIVVGILWALLLVMSVAAVVRIFRRGLPGAGYGQISAMPDRIRRWVFDEPDNQNDRPRDQQ